MTKRRSAHTQAELERMLRAAVKVTGLPHVIEARPDGSFQIVPYTPPKDSGDYSWEPPAALANRGRPVL
jgi:hypothetical protein